MSDTVKASSEPGTGPQWSIDAYLFLTFATLCWGGNAVLGRFAVGEISPLTLVTARWAGVVLLIALFLRGPLQRDWPALKRYWRFVIVMGAAGFTLFNAVFYIAAHNTTAINLGIIQGSIPVFVMIGSYLLYRDKITAVQALGVIVTLIGVVVVVTRGSIERLITLTVNDGDFLMLIASFLYASYAVGLRRRPPVSTLGLFAGMSIVAFLVSLPFMAGEIVLGQFLAPTAKGWLVIVLVTIFPSFVSQICFIKGVDKIGPSRAGVFVNLVPIFAAVMAVAFLGEEFQMFHGTALLLVLFGIFLSEKFKKLR
ncbi:DMT family transporter [Hwanghaeella sp.]|uniref:DMT family transporter n=1 Tax=Hwanghaeella sp. TaxID=2605943 RepID=UPI003CCC1257